MLRKCQITAVVEGSSEFEGNNPEKKWSHSSRQDFSRRLNQLFEEEEDYCWVNVFPQSLPSKLKESEIGVGFFSSTEYVDEAINIEFSENNIDDSFQSEYSDLEENCLYHLVDLDVYIHRDVIHQSVSRLKIYYFLRFLN